MKRWKILLKRTQRDVWPEVDEGVYIADTKAKCKKVLRKWLQQDAVGVDTEYYGFDQKKASPVGKAKAISIQFCGLKGPRVFVPLWTGSGESLDPQGRAHLLQVFKEWFEDRDHPRAVYHNGKVDMHVLANYGIDPWNMLGDTLILDVMWANGEMKHDLKGCIRRYGREKGFAKSIRPYTRDDAKDFKEVFRKPKPLKRRGKNGEILFGKQTYVPPLNEVVRTPEGVKKLIDYAVKDPYFTVKLFVALRDSLVGANWTKLGHYFYYYEWIERPYTRLLFEMERDGMAVDVPHLKDVESRLVADIASTERRFMKLCAKKGVDHAYLAKFNMGSGPQVADLLYGKLRIKCRVFTDKGEPATSKKAFEKLVVLKGTKGEIARLILKRRNLVKLLKTYVRPSLWYAENYNGKVHSTYKQTGTKTGRLSSSALNLQNIPTSKDGDEYFLRKAFIADNDNEEVADIDLSQIEVRLTAHFTREQKLIDMLNNGWDQHLIASGILFNAVREWMAGREPTKALNEEGEKHFGKAVWGEWRRRAKILNFGIIYGMGPKGYAAQTGGTKEEGKKVIADYFKGFPGLAAGIRRVQKECYARGYIRTILRRYSVIPGIRSQDFARRSRAERQAFNYLIQGSAQDILKMGMLLIWRDSKLRKETGLKMRLQVHDELVLTLKKSVVKKVEKKDGSIVKRRYSGYDLARGKVESYVSNPYPHFKMKPLVVPTPADLGHGSNWLEAK